MPKLIVSYNPNHGTPRHCVIDLTEKDLELSSKQFFERFIGPAEYAVTDAH